MAERTVVQIPGGHSADAPAARTYTLGEWTTSDALTLRYRDYGGAAADGRPALLCIPGLTRNSRDFEPVADTFAGEWRVICPDLRGRGRSDYARDAASYTPQQYRADLLALLEQAKLERVVVLGTSLGGIVAMMLAEAAPERVAGAVLNDVGPQIEPAGEARIRGYVGQGRSYPTWLHAARGLREQGGLAYPDFGLSEWLTFAKRLMAVGPGGRIAFDYDMKIADACHGGSAAAGDLWAAFRSLAGRPVLALRGELSDILSAETLARMAREVPGLETVTIARTGHAPTLDEPRAQAAIARLLAKCA